MKLSLPLEMLHLPLSAPSHDRSALLAAPAVILDRDGVINQNRADHVKNWSEFRFLPGAPQAIARLTRAGVRVFVATNQAIVNRGIATHESVRSLLQQMATELAPYGAKIEAVAYCPHRPDEACDCRKPRPGLLIGLCREYRLNPEQTVVIGDALTDLEAGRAAGCRSILVLTGRGQHQLARTPRTDDGLVVVRDLSAAVEVVLEWFVAAGALTLARTANV